MQLDYERYTNRAESLRKKTKRSDRENVALAKHEADVERSTYVRGRRATRAMLRVADFRARNTTKLTRTFAPIYHGSQMPPFRFYPGFSKFRLSSRTPYSPRSIRRSTTFVFSILSRPHLLKWKRWLRFGIKTSHRCATIWSRSYTSCSKARQFICQWPWQTSLSRIRG
jgi:hypothetical protein